MVRVVNSSHYGYGYLENNMQLAKKVSELEQQLSAAVSEIRELRKISHQKEVKIVELDGLVAELASYKAKHDAIKNIILGERPIEPTRASIMHQTTSIQALTETQCGDDNSQLRLPSVSHNESTENEESIEESDRPPASPHLDGSTSTKSANESHEELDEEEEVEEANDDSIDQDNSGRLTANFLQPIIEGNEDEEEEAGGDGDNDPNGTSNTSLPSPSSTQTITPAQDSLEPADITSVPPIDHRERTIHTPSIWNCLDSYEATGESPTKQQPKGSPQKSTQSPARSVGSSTSGGLRLSQNVNSSSPIQPITLKANPQLNQDMFHSTPVQAPGSRLSILSNRRSIPEPRLSAINQENVVTLVAVDSVVDMSVATKRQPAKRGRAAGTAKSKKPVRRAVKFTEEDNQETAEPQVPVQRVELIHEPPAPATRYNLRKRAKI